MLMYKYVNKNNSTWLKIHVLHFINGRSNGVLKLQRPSDYIRQLQNKNKKTTKKNVTTAKLPFLFDKEIL